MQVDSNALADRLHRRLAEIDACGLARSLCPPSGIDLCSNDYLGLAQHPRLKQAMADAALREGCGSTGSRLLRGERACFAHVERSFANFKGVERSLYFSSGYLANLAVLTAFPEPGDVIFSDERNHASLIDGIRLSRARRVVFPHNDVDALARLLGEEKSPAQKFVVVESLFSMDGDEAPLVEYAALCRTHDAALIVDEAHAVGIYGERGSGLIEAIDDSAILANQSSSTAQKSALGSRMADPCWSRHVISAERRPGARCPRGGFGSHSPNGVTPKKNCLHPSGEQRGCWKV